MVQGTRARQNASEKTAPGGTDLHSPLRRLFALTDKGLDVPSLRAPMTSDATIVIPIAAANSPLSGRKRTAIPPVRPAMAHHMNASFLAAALSANVAARHIETARKFVGTSVRIVET